MTTKKLAVSYTKRVDCYTTVEMTNEQQEMLQSYIDGRGYASDDELTGESLEEFIHEHGANVEIERTESVIEEPIDVIEIAGDE